MPWRWQSRRRSDHPKRRSRQTVAIRPKANIGQQVNGMHQMIERLVRTANAPEIAIPWSIKPRMDGLDLKSIALRILLNYVGKPYSLLGFNDSI